MPIAVSMHSPHPTKSMTLPPPSRSSSSTCTKHWPITGGSRCRLCPCRFRWWQGCEDLLLFSLAAPCLFPHSLFSNHPPASLLRSHAFQDRRRSSARRLLFLLSFSPFLDIRSTTASTPYLVLRESVVLIHSRFVSNHSPILNWHTTPFITH